MKKALISVSDKTNIISFARGLIENGYELISTGGTFKTLKEAGLSVIPVEDFTGFPEILGGRVKTLHPRIHGGILALRENEIHEREVQEQQLEYIDLVCVNLYPFKETVNKEDCTLEEAIENIDIGGPSMLRAAAKNYRHVTPVCDPADYDKVLDELKADGAVSKETNFLLAAKVFRHTASYDAIVSGYLTKQTGNIFPESLTMTYDLKQELRYGENPHQKAAFYAGKTDGATLVHARQLNGKELSYNNIQDANAALEIISEFEEITAVAVKHLNPCGIATGKTVYEAFQRVYEADPVSIFGGIVVLNEPVDALTANALSGLFLEIVMAPKFSDEALAILSQKKNLRVLEIQLNKKKETAFKTVSVQGGLLIQEEDRMLTGELSFPTKRKPTDDELKELLFGYQAVKHVKSNAIVLVKDFMTVGVGAGQMNRVGSAKIAIEQAGVKAKSAFMASDAFFPMPDTVEEAAKAGIVAIIQPGGSIKDQESIDACDRYNIAMVFTGVRHFKH